MDKYRDSSGHSEILKFFLKCLKKKMAFDVWQIGDQGKRNQILMKVVGLLNDYRGVKLNLVNKTQGPLSFTHSSQLYLHNEDIGFVGRCMIKDQEKRSLAITFPKTAKFREKRISDRVQIEHTSTHTVKTHFIGKLYTFKIIDISKGGFSFVVERDDRVGMEKHDIIEIQEIAGYFPSYILTAEIRYKAKKGPRHYKMGARFQTEQMTQDQQDLLVSHIYGLLEELAS